MNANLINDKKQQFALKKLRNEFAKFQLSCSNLILFLVKISANFQELVDTLSGLRRNLIIASDFCIENLKQEEVIIKLWSHYLLNKLYLVIYSNIMFQPRNNLFRFLFSSITRHTFFCYCSLSSNCSRDSTSLMPKVKTDTSSRWSIFWRPGWTFMSATVFCSRM